MNDIETVTIEPILANGLIGIHKVITRGISITLENAQSIKQQKLSKTESFNGFLDYLRSLITITNSHHLTEDEIIFPLFQKKSIDAPYNLLKKGHLKIEETLNEMNSTIETLVSHYLDTNIIKKIQNQLQTLDDIWQPHIAIEECRFTENTIGTNINNEEQQQCITNIIEHLTRTSKPEYLIIPFTFYNLSEKDRVMMKPFLPPSITSLLTTWKDHWLPMKPFLLD